MAADLLQSVINKAMSMGLLHTPLQINSCPDFPIVQYADDTLLIMQADTRQLVCLKALLNTFASDTGLKVNYQKSVMVPINMQEERAHLFAGTLNCQLGQFPFTYLGLPLGLYKPTVEKCLPVVNKVARRLAGIATFMTYAGRLLMVKTILTSLTIFFYQLSGCPSNYKALGSKIFRTLFMERARYGRS